MKKLLIFCFLTTGCTVFGPRTFQVFREVAGRGLASVRPAELLCKRLRLSRVKRDNCLRVTRHYEISDSVVSVCANMEEASPEQKVDCVEVVAGKEINETVVSASANWQASPKQIIHFLGAVAGKDVSGFAVTMCEKLWKTAQQRMDCVLESTAGSSAVESSQQTKK